ncbi:hypothetical protein M5689_021273 [Euphorbia peplus]|nr:hypothetical protein M5689_021273 [Euphorbia peplus]
MASEAETTLPIPTTNIPSTLPIATTAIPPPTPSQAPIMPSASSTHDNTKYTMIIDHASSFHSQPSGHINYPIFSSDSQQTWPPHSLPIPEQPQLYHYSENSLSQSQDYSEISGPSLHYSVPSPPPRTHQQSQPQTQHFRLPNLVQTTGLGPTPQLRPIFEPAQPTWFASPIGAATSALRTPSQPHPLV